MNDFSTQLTALLDDVAAGIDPRSDFEAVAATPVPVVSNGMRGGPRFRHPLAVAAVSVALLGGGVAAFQLADDGADRLATSPDVTQLERAARPPDSAGEPKSDRVVAPLPVDDQRGSVDPAVPASTGVKYTAQLGRGDLAGDPMFQTVFGSAAPGAKVSVTSEYGSSSVVTNRKSKWKVRLELSDVPAGRAVPVRVSFAESPIVYEFVLVRPPSTSPSTTEAPKLVDEPKPEPQPQPEPQPEPQTEPQPEPVPIAFAVTPGEPYNDDLYLKQLFYGSATPGSVVAARSEWGAAEAVAGPNGEWEILLELIEVPDATVVHVRVTANTSGSVFEYDLVRHRPQPQPVAFTAKLGSANLGGSPMKQGIYGTGTPGSVVLASTEFGAAEAVVGPKGNWELQLAMYEVPPSTTVGVRVTNNASEAVYEFGLVRSASEPVAIDFTAQAAFTECDSTPPFNEYWGMSTAGAKITISSDFGGKQVTSNGDGNWEARIEFPDAPVGQTFIVTITSSKGSAVYSFPLTRLAPT